MIYYSSNKNGKPADTPKQKGRQKGGIFMGNLKFNDIDFGKKQYDTDVIIELNLAEVSGVEDLSYLLQIADDPMIEPDTPIVEIMEEVRIATLLLGYGVAYKRSNGTFLRPEEIRAIRKAHEFNEDFGYRIEKYYDELELNWYKESAQIMDILLRSCMGHMDEKLVEYVKICKKEIPEFEFGLQAKNVKEIMKCIMNDVPIEKIVERMKKKEA